MDVPTRQAYMMALVPPPQRTAAAATTNTAGDLVLWRVFRRVPLPTRP